MRNRALQALHPDDLARLRPHLVPVELALRTEVLKPYQPTEYVHFVETGFASLLARAGNDKIEVGLIGFESLVGANVVLGVAETPFQAIIQAPGSGLRVKADQLREVMDSSRTLTATLLACVHTQMVQTAQTALANGRLTVEQRLARWLLMAHDRLERDELAMTHEFLALMLGVRRPGVTVALHILEGTHAIRAKRGLITIVNRDVLQSLAGSAYGEPEQASVRLLAQQADGAPAQLPDGKQAAEAPLAT